ncbi:MAG: type IV secretion system protein [Rickettsiaceae bacterium H1]|nr:type IV secretion system protein [Rickettsiaceae bacterium H1]
MFKQWVRMVLLILAIIILDGCNLINQFNSVAYAADDLEPIVGGKANHPSCEGAGVIAAIIGGVGAALATLIAGYALFLAPEPISTGAGTVMLLSAVAALFGIVTGAAEFFACTNGFVRHPVLRWENTGKYKKCKNPEDLFPGDSNSGKVCKSQEYVDESDYKWPENKAPYSDYIEICHRYALVPFPMFNFDGLTDREYEFGLKGDFTEKEIKDKTKDDIVKMKEWVGDPSGPTCKTLKSGESADINGTTFKAYEDGGRICVDAVGLFGGDFWPFPPTIGCHAKAPSPPAPMCEKSVPTEFDAKGRAIKYDNTKCFNCYISGACYSQISLAARAPHPITSVVVQCIKESLANLVAGQCSVASGQTSSQQDGFLAVVQKRLKTTVTAVLVLAIALFGIKMMMGHAIQGPHEYFMLLIKFALVIYFSLGDGMQVYYNYLIKLSVGLSDLVLSAGGNNQVCNYNTADYIKNLGSGDKDYSYLAPWDRLDCRIGFYLGNGFAIGGGAASTAAIIAAATAPVFGILLLIIPAIFSSQILMAICVAFFVFMLLLTVIWIVHLFILSLIALTIVSIFAPVFVPMVLFQATKGFFDGWVKQVMVFSIYPIVLFAFLSLCFSVFDKMYFSDLQFTSKTKNKEVGKGKTRLIEYFIPDYTGCTNNPNIIACVISGVKYTHSNLFLGIKVTKAEIDHEGSKKIWQNFGMMGLMAFLFYHFLGVVGSMAAELSGSFRADLSQGTSGPKQMAAKIEAGAMKVAGGVGGAMKSVGKAAMNKGKSGGGDDGGKERVLGSNNQPSS